MCLSSPKPPKAPPVKERPKSDETGAQVQKTRRKAAEAPGVFGNIFTSALGDTNYGSNVSR